MTTKPCPDHCPVCSKYGDEIELTSYGCCERCGYDHSCVVWSSENDVDGEDEDDSDELIDSDDK